MDKFKIGDRVKYTSGKYDDSFNNPLWGGNEGNVIGNVKGYNDKFINVNWDNGSGNRYIEDALKLVEPRQKTNTIIY